MFIASVSDGVATLTLSHSPVNAIGVEWVRLFNAELDSFGSRMDWKILHIRSDQRVFCAGADLKEVRERLDASDGPDRMYAFVAGIQRLYARIEQLPQVSLAEIEGAAMGGGLELALACDLRIASAEAKLGLPEAQLGLIPGAGGTQRLTRLCSRSVAARLILGAETIDGETARELGVVHWTAPRALVRERAVEIVRRIANLPAAALRESKACIAAAAEPGKGGYSDEIEATRKLMTNSETRERIQRFLAGRSNGSKKENTGAAR